MQLILISVCCSRSRTQQPDRPWYPAPCSTAVYWGAWIALVLLVMKISTFEAEAVYSPFDVLGLEESASTPEIKKAYRELSRLYHPDRNLDDEDAADKFIRISKAYEALTDEVTRANWEKYGNPDGRQIAEFGTATSTLFLDHFYWVLIPTRAV